MTATPQSKMEKKSGIEPEIDFIIAHHDSQIMTLNDRMGGVEVKLDTVVRVVNDLASQMKIEASKPTFNAHATLGVVKDVGVMMAMMVASIVWVTSGQFDKSFSIIEERGRAVIAETAANTLLVRNLSDRIILLEERLRTKK